MSKKERPDIVEVEIYDQRYPLRLSSPAEREEILRLAQVVDGRMRDIARQSGTVDSLKVAILAALHLAQDSSAHDLQERGLEEAIKTGANKWVREIDRVLKSR